MGKLAKEVGVEVPVIEVVEEAEEAVRFRGGKELGRRWNGWGIRKECRIERELKVGHGGSQWTSREEVGRVVARDSKDSGFSGYSVSSVTGGRAITIPSSLVNGK